MYQFGNGDGYFTLQVGSTYYAPDSEESVGFTMEEVDSVQVTTAKKSNGSASTAPTPRNMTPTVF